MYFSLLSPCFYQRHAYGILFELHHTRTHTHTHTHTFGCGGRGVGECTRILSGQIYEYFSHDHDLTHPYWTRAYIRKFYKPQIKAVNRGTAPKVPVGGAMVMGVKAAMGKRLVEALVVLYRVL